MTDKKYIEYYPNRVSKLNDFPKQLKDRERFNDYCNGKNEHFYKDEGNYGYRRNNEHFTYDQRLEREYLWNDFGFWTTWQKSGRNIFDFSEGLLEMLKDTDVSDIDLEKIKLPYPNFYVDISKAKIPFAEGFIPLVEGVFVAEEINKDINEDITYEKVISFNFTGDYIKHFKHINDKLYNHVRGFHSYSLYLDRPYNLLNVGDAVKDAKSMFLDVDTWEDHDDDTKIDLYKIHSDFIERTIKLVVNCLLYLSLKDKDVTEKFTSDLPIHLKTKLEKANTKRKKEVANNEIRNFGFTKIKFAGLHTFPSNKYDKTTGQISPHWRRGHWRNQKFGENLSQSKLLWIMPTIVNKDKGEPLKGHIYSVENKN